MTPEQEQKFEGLFSKFSEKQDQLAAIVIKAREDSEARDRKLASAILEAHEKTREDASLGFSVLENMLHQVRDELVALVTKLEEEAVKRLDKISSDVLHNVHRITFQAEQIESALATGVKLTENMNLLLEEVRKLRRGVAATYDRSGGQNSDAAAEIEASESSPDRGRRI